MEDTLHSMVCASHPQRRPGHVANLGLLLAGLLACLLLGFRFAQDPGIDTQSLLCVMCGTWGMRCA